VRALIVEDSSTTRRIIAAILRDLAFEVIEAGDGKEALARLGEGEAPALIVVDWNMPELDGLGVVRAVRADRVYDGVRIVMVTTEVEKGRVVTALEAGADEYLMKPFTREMLAEKLALIGFQGA
jgi:two-component system, chemotaxis family, chemotaxis protein CheY